MNILLPTDFSENSRNATAYALQLFKDIPCTFHFLHVTPVKGGRFQADYLNIPASIQKEFDNLINWAQSIKKNPAHQFNISYKADFLIEAVREQVIQKGIDLILMGTKGVSNHEETIIGKNTSDVMMKVKCSVLAISENAVYRDHKEILFPTDYKIAYNSAMLSTLLNLSSLSKSSIKVLELYASDEEPTPEQLRNRKFLQNTFTPNEIGLQTYYASKNKADKMFSVDDRIDMIVMVAKNLNICHKFLKNHHTNEIPLINQLPLLILH